MVGGMDEIYGGDETTGKLWKWTIDLENQTCKEEQIDNKSCDFARVDDRRVGLKSNYGYAMELNNKAETLTFGNHLFKYNLIDGTREDQFLGNNTLGGEPVFAPTNKSNSELDGYVMSIVHDLEKDQSKLIILDAENFSDKPIAEILLPQRVPFGAHGSWLEN
jgi:carotenoid cleavage dioxygenase